MKPIVIIAPRFLKAISFVVDIEAITLFPFIISRTKMDPVLERHEKIHIAQQKELFVLFFYLIYGFDYLKGFIKYKSKTKAYFRIRMEQEAYINQQTEDYLKTRTRFKWLDYKV